MKSLRRVQFASVPMAAIVAIVVIGCQPSQPKSGRQDGTLPPTSLTNSAPKLPTEPATGAVLFFKDVAASVGIQFTRNDDIHGLHRLMESTGGGVGILDFDGDGWPDVFFTNGCRLPLSLRDTSSANALYQNLGQQGFRDVAAAAGLSLGGYCQGCTTGDFNNDGFEDLYVGAYGQSVLYCNQGDGTFRDVTLESGTAVGGWSSSPAFADLNGDGNLDLFVVTYVDAQDDPPRLCPEPASKDGYIQCSPTMFRATDDVLFLGDGQGGFMNCTTVAGVAGVDGKGLGIAIFDVNGDNLPDIFVANDGTPNFLHLQQGPANETGAKGIAIPKYVDQAFEKGVAVSSSGKAQAGMGVAVADVDGDGWLDIYVTNFFGEPNSLFRNLAGTNFLDASAASGLGPASRPLLGFGAEFLDADNDGWPDLIVTNGHVDDLTSFTSVPYQMPPLVFRSKQNGSFQNVTRWAGAYCQQNWLGRGLATADLNRDGRLDVLISCQRSPSAVLKNETGESGRSCRLRLIGTGSSNRSGFHTTVRVKGIMGPPVRHVIGGGSFQSASDRTVHVGMGTSEVIPSITIRWPDGTVEEFQDLPAGEFAIVQGQRPWKLPID